MADDVERIRAVRQDDGKAPQQFSGLRRCPKCGSKLSRYNPNAYCYLHAPLRIISLLPDGRTRRWQK